MSVLQPADRSGSDVDDLVGAVERRARRLLDDHGLHDWTFRWDRAKQRVGLCRFARQEISLSRPLVERNGLDQAIETLLHEIAHALVGPAHGHDATWRATVVAIGGRPERVARGLRGVPAAWVGHCPTCGRGKAAHRRNRLFCGPCADRHFGGRDHERVELVWSRAEPG